MIKKFSAVLILILLVGCSHFISNRNNAAKTPAISFVKEQINIRVNANSLTIKGFYYIKNNKNSSLKRTFLYPFPIDDNHPFPDSIAVFQVDENGKEHPVVFKNSPSAVVFSLEFQPQEELLFIVDYEQACRNSKGEYILTTTKYWHEPLEQMHIITYVPQNIEITDSAYRLGKGKMKNNEVVYHVKRKNIIPEKDFVLEWSVK